MRSSGSECNHNAVDGEAALQFTLGFLHAAAERAGGREALRGRLMGIAKRERANGTEATDLEKIKALEAQLAAAEEELKLIRRNWALAKDDVAHEALGSEYKTQQMTITGIRAKLEKLKAIATAKPSGDSAADVDLALALFDQLKSVGTNPTARSGIAALLNKIQFRMWLSFAPVKRGKRTLRKLKGGIVTSGECKSPSAPVRFRWKWPS